MIRKTLQELGREFADISFDVFERQSTATPCVFYHEGRFDFSRGDILGGEAEAVYNDKADIVIDTDVLREYAGAEYDEEEASEKITEELIMYLDELKEV